MGKLRLSCRELHVGELHPQPQRARQADAEVFLAADQASNPVVEVAAVFLTVGGRRSSVGGARAYTASDGADTRAYADGSGAYAYETKGQAVRWSLCKWRR